MSDYIIHAAQVPSPTELGLDQISTVMQVPANGGTPPGSFDPAMQEGGAVIDNTNGPFESLVTENGNGQDIQPGGQAAPMPDTGRVQDQAPEPIDAPYAGGLIISVVSSLALIPIENAVVTISYTGDPETPIETLITDSSGQTETVELPAPPLSLSLEPSEEQPYAEYNIMVTAEGYEPVYVSGSEIFADELSLQPIRMNPLETTEEKEKVVVIPAHTLFGEYPPKIPEDEIKPMAETGEIVLSRVVIPEYIIVHDGVPMDPTASNYWVRYKDYIKNVASCEIYSTWPEATIYANILAIMSFTLNRVYTEWYGDCLFLLVLPPHLFPLDSLHSHLINPLF